MIAARRLIFSGALALAACVPNALGAEAKPPAPATPPPSLGDSPFAPNSTVYLLRDLTLRLPEGKKVLPKGAPAIVVRFSTGTSLVVLNKDLEFVVSLQDVTLTENPAIPQAVPATDEESITISSSTLSGAHGRLTDRVKIGQEIGRIKFDLKRAETELKETSEAFEKSSKKMFGSSDPYAIPRHRHSSENKTRIDRIIELTDRIDQLNAKLKKLETMLTMAPPPA